MPAGVTIRLRRTLRVAPNRVCCNALLAAYARARHPQWAKVLSSGISILTEHITHCLQLLACVCCCCVGLFLEFSGYFVHHSSCAISFRPLAMCVQALVLLGAMWEAGAELQPDTVSYNAALKACGSAREIATAMQARPLLLAHALQGIPGCRCVVRGLVLIY